MPLKYQSKKSNDANDQATSVKNPASGTVAARLDKAKNVDCSDDASDMVLEKFSSCNLEQPPKQGSNHSFNSGGRYS